MSAYHYESVWGSPVGDFGVRTAAPASSSRQTNQQTNHVFLTKCSEQHIHNVLRLLGYVYISHRPQHSVLSVSYFEQCWQRFVKVLHNSFLLCCSDLVIIINNISVNARWTVHSCEQWKWQKYTFDFFVCDKNQVPSVLPSGIIRLSVQVYLFARHTKSSVRFLSGNRRDGSCGSHGQAF